MRHPDRSAAARVGRTRRGFLSTAVLVVAAIVLVTAFVASAYADDAPLIGADISGGINLGNWPAGSTVHVVIDADNNPSNGNLAAFNVAMGTDTWKYTDRDQFGDVNLQPGMWVRATQGATTATLHLVPIAVTAVDAVANTIRGTASAGVAVHVSYWPRDDGDDLGRDVTADSTGKWVADFTGLHDLVRGDNGGAMRSDANGNWTQASWRIPACRIGAGISEGVNFEEWPAGSTIHFTIDADNNPGNGVLFTGSATVDGDGNQNVDPDHLGGLNLQPGQYVTATQGTTTVTLHLASVAVTAVDPAADTVRGTADAGAAVRVEVWNTDEDIFKAPVAGSTGEWLANFTGTYDIVAGSEGGALRFDADGNYTYAHWRVPNPRIHVSPMTDNIALEEWTTGTTVTVTVDSDTNPGNGVLFRRVFDPIDESGWGGDDVNFDLKPGQYVTATSGATTKTLRIASMSVTAANPAADTISGTAASGARLDVWVDNTDAGTQASANAAGKWVARFRGSHNLVAGERGQASVEDADGDSTQASWAATSVTIKRNLSSVKRGKAISLSGACKPVDLGGQVIQVQVKKPGKTTWTTIAVRVATRRGSSATWSWKYTIPKTAKLGSYSFRAVYARSGALTSDRYELMGCTSSTVKATVTP